MRESMCVMYAFKCYENVSLIFLPCMYVWNTCEMKYDMRYELVYVYGCMPRYEMYVWCYGSDMDMHDYEMYA